MAVQWNSMGLAIANAAKHKLIGLLTGLMKGTAWDTGNAVIEARTIADRFSEIYSKRESRVVTLS